MSEGPRIAVLDYKMSNLRSACKALERVGGRVEVVEDPRDAHGADGVVLPGVGHFGEAMRRLRDAGLDTVVRDAASAGTPVLGICLGMQLLLDSSVEAPGVPGLGLIPGVVRRLTTDRKIPQIGWNPVRWSPDAPLGTLAEAPRRTYYFVHSFAACPSDDAHVTGRADYGGEFVAAIARDNVAGVQFHPEKSSRAGLALLQRWVGEVGGARRQPLETTA